MTQAAPEVSDDVRAGSRRDCQRGSAAPVPEFRGQIWRGLQPLAPRRRLAEPPGLDAETSGQRVNLCRLRAATGKIAGILRASVAQADAPRRRTTTRRGNSTQNEAKHEARRDSSRCSSPSHPLRVRRDALGRVGAGRTRDAAGQAGRDTAGAVRRPAVEDEVDVQLQRRLGHVRIRQLALRQSQGARRRREPERPMVRGLRQAGAVRRATRSRRPAKSTERSAPSANGPTARSPRTSGRTSRRSGPRICRLAGGPERRSSSARTRWISSSAGRSTSWVTASWSTTDRPKAAAAAATGPTRARRSSSPRSAASSPAHIPSNRSISTRTSSRRTTRAAGCGA